MFKKTLLGLAMCVAISGTAMAAVTEKVETGDNFKFTYPVFSFENQKAETKANSFISKEVDKTAKLLRNPMYREVATSYEVINENDDFVSVTFTSYNYTGGAHGMSTTYGVVFDKETGKRVPYTHFTDKVNAKQLKEDILEGKVKVFTADLKTESKAPFLQDYKAFKVSKNYIVDKDGHVYLMYQPYELDSYAAGVTYVQIK